MHDVLCSRWNLRDASTAQEKLFSWWVLLDSVLDSPGTWSKRKVQKTFAWKLQTHVFNAYAGFFQCRIPFILETEVKQGKHGNERLSWWPRCLRLTSEEGVCWLRVCLGMRLGRLESQESQIDPKWLQKIEPFWIMIKYWIIVGLCTSIYRFYSFHLCNFPALECISMYIYVFTSLLFSFFFSPVTRSGFWSLSLLLKHWV